MEYRTADNIVSSRVSNRCDAKHTAKGPIIVTLKDGVVTGSREKQRLEDCALSTVVLWPQMLGIYILEQHL